MSAAQYKITVDRSTDYRLALQVGTTDDTNVFTPDDILADSFVFNVCDPSDTSYGYSGEIVIDGSYIRLHLTPETTSSFNAHKRYAYTLDRIYASGDRKRVLEGALYARAGA